MPSNPSCRSSYLLQFLCLEVGSRTLSSQLSGYRSRTELTLLERLNLDLNSLTKKSAAATVTSYFNTSPPGQTIPGVNILIEDPTFNDNQSPRIEELERAKLILSKFDLSLEKRLTPNQNGILQRINSPPRLLNSFKFLRIVSFRSIDILEEKVTIEGQHSTFPVSFKQSRQTSHKKYFGDLSSGGKRRYSVVIAVDCSISMQSFTAECVVKSLILFVSALNQIGIEFSVVTYGEQVSLLKDAGIEWTSTHVWMLLSQLTFEDYASSGRRLPVALQRAHLEGVEVIAIAVGMDSFGVSHSYSSWIECALPNYIPEALRNLYHGDEPSLSVANEGRKWQEFYMSN
jgi:hypothetical protein